MQAGIPGVLRPQCGLAGRLRALLRAEGCARRRAVDAVGAGTGPARAGRAAGRAREIYADPDPQREDRPVSVRAPVEAPARLLARSAASSSSATSRSSSRTTAPTSGRIRGCSSSSRTGSRAWWRACRPDYFSATGQLWGNPLYNWEAHKAQNYDWWVARLRRIFELVDIVRIDHFRGFEAYWEIPGGETTAINGKWVKGPDQHMFDVLLERMGPLPIIAEDLGVITPAGGSPARPLRISRACASCSSRSATTTAPTNSVPRAIRRIAWSIPARTTTTRRWAGSTAKPARAAPAPQEEIDAERKMILDYLQHRRPRNPLGPDRAGLALERQHLRGAVAGPARAGLGSPHEHARRRRRQLAVALCVGASSRMPSATASPM